jgi:hypothetical protein
MSLYFTDYERYSLRFLMSLIAQSTEALLSDCAPKLNGANVARKLKTKSNSE